VAKVIIKTFFFLRIFCEVVDDVCLPFANKPKFHQENFLPVLFIFLQPVSRTKIPNGYLVK
jgi:hypothetical protein